VSLEIGLKKEETGWLLEELGKATVETVAARLEMSADDARKVLSIMTDEGDVDRHGDLFFLV
jgi:hypothetical protein